MHFGMPPFGANLPGHQPLPPVAGAPALPTVTAAAAPASPAAGPQSEGLYCVACSVLCRSPDQWLDHLTGQKHRKRTAQASAADCEALALTGSPGGPSTVVMLQAYQQPPPEVANAILQAASKLGSNGNRLGSRLRNPSGAQGEYRWVMLQLCRHLCLDGAKADHMFTELSQAVRPHHRHPAWAEEAVRRLSGLRGCITRPGHLGLDLRMAFGRGHVAQHAHQCLLPPASWQAMPLD